MSNGIAGGSFRKGYSTLQKRMSSKSDCTLPANMLQFQKANKWRDWSRIHMNKNKSGRTHRMPSIRKNYTYNLIYQVMTLLTPFITTPYLSRVLGPDERGSRAIPIPWCSILPLRRLLEQPPTGRGRLPCTGMIGKR